MLIDFQQYFDNDDKPKLRTIYEISAILKHLYPQSQLKSVSPLSGGFRNEHYLLELESSSETHLVLKVSSDLESSQKEANLLRKLHYFLPVPQVHKDLCTSKHYFGLMGYLKGQSPDYLTQENNLLDLGLKIGQVLAKIHQTHFEGSGFLDADLNFSTPFDNLGQVWLDYIRQVLGTDFSLSTLGEKTLKEIQVVLNQNESLLLNLSQTKSLVHSDFNLKNLLVVPVGEGFDLSGVLDWEFAHAGCPLTDLGNFFRFEDHLPADLFTGFLQGYQEGGETLPENWRAISYLLDLAAMCNFLERERPGSKSTHTAKKQIEKTIQYFQNQGHI